MGILLRALSGAAVMHITSAKWVLQWADEFDGPTVNETNWNIYSNVSECGMPGCTGNQIELYTANNVWVDSEDGHSALVLRTQPETVVWPGYTFNITSGRVDTMAKINVTYGRVEISAKLQNDAAAKGIHTAHWLLGYDCWPVGGEIDIMEMQSPGNIYHSTAGAGAGAVGDTCASNWAKATSNYHISPDTCGKETPHHTGSSAWPPAPDAGVNFTSTYNTFAVEWNATDLVYFVVLANGTSVQVNHVWAGMPGWVNGTATIPSWPMFIILSQAYMSDRPCGDPPAWAWPVLQRIDYVRVYEWVAAQDSEGENRPALALRGEGNPRGATSA